MQNQAPQADFNYVERTFDTDLVRSILSDPELKKRGGDYVDIEAYDPANQPDLIYLTPKHNDTVLGVIVLHVLSHPICLQGHVNYLPKFWGMGLANYTKHAIQWVWDNTECSKIVAVAPDNYPEV